MKSLKTVTVLLALVSLPGLTESRVFPHNETDVLDNRLGDETQVLKEISQYYSQYINLKVDPCQDFYEFSCGKAKLVKPRFEVDVFAREEALVKRRIEILIKDRHEIKQVGPNLNRIRALYDSCSLGDESRNRKALRSLAAQLGGAPVLGEKFDWIPGKVVNWIDLLSKLRRSGLKYDSLFDVGVDIDPSNSSISVMKLDLPYFSLDESMVIDVESYSPLLAALGASTTSKDVKSQFLVLGDIQYKLSKIYDDAGGSSPQLMPVEQLQVAFPSIDWISLLTGLTDYRVLAEDKIMVYGLRRLQQLINLIGKLQPGDIVNHIMISALDDLFHWIMETQKDCVKFVEKSMPLALTAEYIRRFVATETLTEVRKLVVYFRRELNLIIANANWVSEETKKAALAKADAMRAFLGFSDQLLDKQFMEKFFSPLSMRPDLLVVNLLKLNTFEANLEFSKLAQTRSSYAWQLFEQGLEVNAFYHPELNSFFLMPGMLQGTIFHPVFPHYINFASLGSTIGHEISHAFDANCVAIDFEGNTRCWWDPKTEANYRHRAECFAQQYDKIQVKGADFKVDGRATLSENIADNIGHLIAFRAYESLVRKQGTEKMLPGLKLSWQQMFWVSLANGFCTDESPQEIKRRYKGDTHSPPSLRVNIALSNLDQFSEAFSCPLGSPMRPKARCSIW